MPRDNATFLKASELSLPAGATEKALPWFCLKSGAMDPAFNMACDEALLEAMPRIQRPVLRFYAWTEPAASFGYFQRYSDVELLTPLRPLIRRPTAGGIVPHAADWTYSLAFPTTHEWYALTARDSYRRLHCWVKEAFAELNQATELAPEPFKPILGQCFVGHEQADLLWRGRKVAGAAQRRRKDGMLIQGSIQPPIPTMSRIELEKAMLESARRMFGIDWRAHPDEPLLQQRALELREAKYSRPDHNRRR